MAQRTGLGECLFEMHDGGAWRTAHVHDMCQSEDIERRRTLPLPHSLYKEPANEARHTPPIIGAAPATLDARGMRTVPSAK